MNRKGQSAKKTRFIAISAILCSLGTLLLYLGSVIEILDLTAGAIASLLVVMAVIEMGGKWPYLIWLVTSALSLILLPNKFIALFYLLFYGAYPILKSKIEKLNSIVSWVLKLVMFNASLAIVIFVTMKIVTLANQNPDLAFTWTVFAVSNVTFVLFDVALSKLITVYLLKFRHSLRIKNYFQN